VEDKRRVASLLEEYKDADAEPDQPNDRQKDYRRRPARNTIDVFQIGEIKIVPECL